ncbi:hypothetical protein [Frigoribacterium sp. CFBP 8751]|uniref:hypothetical protein n=1 Tax=Frigoribacterium sp. CFBP 8751 TaxID=2775277 RepID=UPI00177C656A|nr:hypothetical protein [Frigoribacterium sp. CFBP 8751]MBD8537669.1 hypothetical protein [Frigoribacterium sp. CFBP 8751]
MTSLKLANELAAAIKEHSFERNVENADRLVAAVRAIVETPAPSFDDCKVS